MTTNKRRQTGLFFGSFNPIHVGHLILANYMLEFTYLDDVWFVVSPRNPLKESKDLLDDSLRLKITQLALSDYPKMSVSDIEFSMSLPSYTVKTLKRLRDENLESDFTLIIGSDNWSRFHLWKDYRVIKNEFNILIYPRLGDKIEDKANLPDNIQVVDAPVIDISSTFIRQSIKDGKDIRAFLPAGVYDLITEEKLYH